MSPFLVMLLASLGPMLVGFIGLDGEDDDQSDAEVEMPEETVDDPIETVDVATFIESARSAVDNTTAATVTRGTDQDEEFVARPDENAHHDASGGNDTLTGSTQNDTLAGGDGSDVIEGGDGDDALFGAFGRETRADDESADTLDGGAGDDTLFLGDGDTGTGGSGSDVFAATQDAVDVIHITDFNVNEDVIAIETEAPEELSILDQTVEEGGLRIEISTGLSIRLEGVTTVLPVQSVQFVPVTALESA
jgi:hypothetical protein